jgi:hypothetical protein
METANSLSETVLSETALSEEGKSALVGGSEHDPEKWKPVFRKDHAQSKR